MLAIAHANKVGGASGCPVRAALRQDSFFPADMPRDSRETIEADAAGAKPAMRPRWLHGAACGALALAAALAGGWGGAMGAALAALAAIGCATLAGRPAGAAWRAVGHDSALAAAPIADDGAGAATTGPRLMARAVLPVWRRQIEASRTQAEQGSGELLAAFAGISDGLSRLAANVAQAGAGGGAAIDAGTAADLVERNAAALDELLGPMLEADRARRAMLDELGEVGAASAELLELGKAIRSLARHTGLVALNASIEANRSGQSGGGAGAIAVEVRTLADRTGETSERLCARLATLTSRLDAVRHEAELTEPSEALIRMQARQQARAVMRAMLADAQVALSSADELRALGARLHDEIETVFMSLQGQDRLEQMLAGVCRDIERLEHWLEVERPAGHADAARWLEQLERTYTMQEQRSRHHGTVQMSHAAAVEFF